MSAIERRQERMDANEHRRTAGTDMWAGTNGFKHGLVGVNVNKCTQ